MYPIQWHTDKSGNLVIERLTDEQPLDIYDACEAMTANDSYDWIRPEEIGALTSAPIIGYGVVRDDTGTLVSVERVWWYPQYETKDEVAELMAHGRIVLTKAPESEREASARPRS